MNPQNLNRKNFLAGLTFFSAGSMRFRWNEENPIRNTFFTEFLGPYTAEGFGRYGNYFIEPLELIHSKTVIAVDQPGQTKLCRADGIITCNPLLVPVLTVADCMPIYLWEPKTACFGVLHSGWKGTGIVTEALSLAHQRYGAKIADFYVILGPHIRACCYAVEKERAEYFMHTFTADCVQPVKTGAGKNPLYALSLEKANLAVLKKAGIPRENIICVGECTCCAKNSDTQYRYGSFRRETVKLPESMSLQEKLRHFTPMVAFMCMGSEYLVPPHNTNVFCMNDFALVGS